MIIHVVKYLKNVPAVRNFPLTNLINLTDSNYRINFISLFDVKSRPDG